MFKITADQPTKLVRVDIIGFWQVEEVAPFFAREQEAVRSLGVPPGTHRLLVDVREMKLQSQDVVNALRTAMETAMLKAGRFAFIVPPGLVKQQVKRAVGKRSIGVFDGEAEARAYIFNA